MFQCCQFGRYQYINEDGTLDMKRYYEAVRNTINEFIDKMIVTNPNGSKTKGIIPFSFDPNKICMCPCHQDGQCIMH